MGYKLKIELMGGVRLDRLDTLRTTLKVTNKENSQAYRQNLDLYHNSSVTKFIRIATEEIQCGLENLTIHINELIELLEEYRLTHYSGDQKSKVPQLTPNQEQEALQYLRKKDLHQRTQADIQKAGIVGEEINSILLYYIYTTRKMANPLHGICFSPSGTGKTHLLDQIAQLIPKHERISLTDISAKALYYLEEDALEHKLLIIEDLEGAMDALYPIRELQSKKEISRLVTMQNENGVRTAHRQYLRGPVSIAGATTQDDLYEDNANRSFLLYMDASKEQDERIMEYQRKLAAGKIDTHEQNQIKKQFQSIQQLLKPIKIINPFAEYLTIPNTILKPRRTNVHYLNFINAVTFYHQYQRKQIIDETTGEVYIETTKEDIEIANSLLKEVLLRKSDKLSGGCRTFYEGLKKRTQSTFTTSELLRETDTPRSSLFRYISQLEEQGRIQVIENETEKIYQLTHTDDYGAKVKSQEKHFDQILQYL